MNQCLLQLSAEAGKPNLFIGPGWAGAGIDECKRKERRWFRFMGEGRATEQPEHRQDDKRTGLHLDFRIPCPIGSVVGYALAAHIHKMERPDVSSGNSVDWRAVITNIASDAVNMATLNAGCRQPLLSWLVAAICVTVSAVPIVAAGAAASDPDWPCQQIKVADLSFGSAWSGPPVDPTQINWKDDNQIADLVQILSPRRKPIDQAEAIIDDFARQSGDRKQPRLMKLLAGLFTVFDTERDGILAGLDRFGRRQKELAAEIRADNEKLHALQVETTADAGTIQRLTQQVAWEAEVFQDRRQAISYACDAPSKIEQRFFALARHIQQILE